jgi:hypothetical protein
MMGLQGSPREEQGQRILAPLSLAHIVPNSADADGFSHDASSESYISKFTRDMNAGAGADAGHGAAHTMGAHGQGRPRAGPGFPFASVSMLVILGTLFVMSMIRGGWSWSSWTYAFSFVIVVPLAFFEHYRKAVITGSAMILLFFMALIDAGMPGYFGYSPSDYNWYDNWAHLIGTFGLTLFLWAFIWWTLRPDGPPNSNGTRKFVLTITIMVVVSFFFEFTEFFSDYLFGWTNFHPGIDTIGDLIFDFAGIACAAVLIARHRYSPLKKPFWYAERAQA